MPLGDVPVEPLPNPLCRDHHFLIVSLQRRVAAPDAGFAATCAALLAGDEPRPALDDPLSIPQVLPGCIYCGDIRGGAGLYVLDVAGLAIGQI